VDHPKKENGKMSHGILYNRIALVWIASILLVAGQVQAEAEHATGNSVAQASPASSHEDPGSTGRVAGVVYDSSGAVVAGAEVSILSLASPRTQVVITDQQGGYHFSAIEPGQYRIVVASPGFETSRKEIAVHANQTATAGIILKVALRQENVVVSADTLDSNAYASSRVRTSDTASMLDGIAGVSMYNNGGLSSLPAIHGLADDRVKVVVNGMTITSHCANHMNPALSYITPGNVAILGVLAGITPVSQGGDSLTGTISVESKLPEFAAAGQRVLLHGGVTAYHRSNANISGGDANLSGATAHFSASYLGSYVNADDYTSGAGLRVMASRYQARNHALALAVHNGNHLFTLRLGYQNIPVQGFPNDYMDMTKNDAKLVNASYQGSYKWGKLDGRFYRQFTKHEMNTLPERHGMNMPMLVRGGDFGYTAKAELPLNTHDTLRVGTEFHRYTLNDWWPAVMNYVSEMGPDTFWNVRGGWRDHFGTYVEWKTQFKSSWTAVLGIRNDEILMNTGAVTGYNTDPNAQGGAAYYADAIAFNSRNHYRVDNDLDLTALASYQATSRSFYEFGYARKSRAPNLYERYLWAESSYMAATMNGWYGDLNGYVGNLDLRPEIGDTVSASADWQSAAAGTWSLKVSPYFNYVHDYINVVRYPINVCAQIGSDGNCPFGVMQFANQTAQLHGLDATGRLHLGDSSRLGDFTIANVLSYVRGKNPATGKNLYNIMPLNSTLTVEHELNHWSNHVTLQAFDAKRKVEAVRHELHTAGYVLANYQTSYRWSIGREHDFRLDAGIDNIGNRNYALPLGGRYYGQLNNGLMQVPGAGRSFRGGLTLTF
jgi:iron complex outermembrane receptor protein